MTKSQTKTHFTTTNVALISIFSALWIVLNLTIAPLGFQLTRVPIVHGIISLFILLLSSWATSRYGAASAVGMVGSVIVLLAGGPLPVLGFAAASLLFDVVLVLNHHIISLKTVNIAVSVAATVVSRSVEWHCYPQSNADFCSNGVGSVDNHWRNNWTCDSIADHCCT
jgi:hypothetical protein